MTHYRLGSALLLGALALGALPAAAQSGMPDPSVLFRQIESRATAPAGESGPSAPAAPQSPVTANQPSPDPTDVPGGPQCGDLRITKYACPKGTAVTRDANGPRPDGSHTYPAGCVKQRGAHFGYHFEPGKPRMDFSGPYPGKSDAARFMPFRNSTNARGQLIVEYLQDPDGRYALAELDAAGMPVSDQKVLGFFCTDDAGDGGDNYALTFLEKDGTDFCVVYNGDDADGTGGTTTPPDAGTSTPPVGSSTPSGGGGGGACVNCGDDDDDDSPRRGDDDDDDDRPRIELERNIAGTVDLPDVPKTGHGPAGSLLAPLVAAFGAIAAGIFLWRSRTL